MLRYVYSTLISNTQKLERTQMSFNIGMDTDNVVYLHNKYYSAIKNNEFMKFIGKWMELDNIILIYFQSGCTSLQSQQKLPGTK